MSKDRKKVANFGDKIRECENTIRESELPDNIKSIFNSEIMKIERENMQHLNLVMKMLHEVLTHIASIKNDTHSIKSAQDKANLIIMGIIFVTGIMLGSQYKIWLPYASNIIDTVKNAREIAK